MKPLHPAKKAPRFVTSTVTYLKDTILRLATGILALAKSPVLHAAIVGGLLGLGYGIFNAALGGGNLALIIAPILLAFLATGGALAARAVSGAEQRPIDRRDGTHFVVTFSGSRKSTDS